MFPLLLALALAPDYSKVDFGTTPAVRVRLLKHKNPGVRRRAAMLLAHAPPDAAIAGLLVALSDNNAGVRRASAVSLGVLADERAVPFLARRLRLEGHAGVQAALLISLARCGKSYVARMVAVFLDSPRRNVRVAAAVALGHVADAGQRSALWATLRYGPDDAGFRVRSAVLGAFLRLGWKRDAKQAVKELEEAGALRHWASHVAVVSAVGLLGMQERVDWLRTELESEDPRIVAAAAGSLAALGRADEVAAKLRHESPMVRRACLVALQDAGDPRAVERARVMVENDAAADVRFEAALVLDHASAPEADRYLVDALRSRNALYWITALGALERRHKRSFGRDPDAWSRFLTKKGN